MTEFDQWVNVAFWVVTWLTVVFYTLVSKAPPRKAFRYMMTIVLAVWGTALLLKGGVPDGQAPIFFWNTP